MSLQNTSSRILQIFLWVFIFFALLHYALQWTTNSRDNNCNSKELVCSSLKTIHKKSLPVSLSPPASWFSIVVEYFLSFRGAFSTKAFSWAFTFVLEIALLRFKLRLVKTAGEKRKQIDGNSFSCYCWFIFFFLRPSRKKLASTCVSRQVVRIHLNKSS